MSASRAYPSTNHAPNFMASRSTYPTFLSFQDTAFLQLRAAGRGLLHASRWDIVVRLVISDPEIRSNVLKSLLLNVLSLASISFLDHLLLPLAANQQKWLHRNVGWFYQVLWLLPVVGMSFYLNSTWFNLIAKRSFTLQYGTRAHAASPSTYTGILNSIATSAYRVVMVFTSVVVSFSLGYIPLAGPVASFIFLCWVDAYYCFEFIWITRGHSLSRRLRHLEERWAYYLGFGLPTTALCMWGSTLANAAVFALVFPSYIIMAMHARPEPLDPYNPSGSDVVRHPSPFIPIRIPIFAPVTFLNDWIIRVINIGSLIPGAITGANAPPRPQHRRTISDDAESIEQGDAIPMSPGRTHAPLPSSSSTRVRLGRKRD
ncbi:etoposide-induced protein 2.4-domain-containing protein [Cristinia sonorae]|uniref:Etoposide-induced protein 2.4-domain-containing protein n=1 Tax=Cristinia sonorae TaxID=1940300 RepID=A0A8K0UYX5_9AGAR|nr:etoposide-induced protein 2.4-domain-containing protein [Cristinia sonorae]